jgi:hypothetical protein
MVIAYHSTPDESYRIVWNAAPVQDVKTGSSAAHALSNGELMRSVDELQCQPPIQIIAEHYRPMEECGGEDQAFERADRLVDKLDELCVRLTWLIVREEARGKPRPCAPVVEASLR